MTDLDGSRDQTAKPIWDWDLLLSPMQGGTPDLEKNGIKGNLRCSLELSTRIGGFYVFYPGIFHGETKLYGNNIYVYKKNYIVLSLKKLLAFIQ